MQAVVLAAGESSRFYPLNANHKSCFRLLGKSLISHTLLSLKKAGIKIVVIVVGKNDEVKKSIEKDKISGLSIIYVTQEMPEGMGDALLRVESYIRGDFFLLHAHHVDFHEFSDLMQRSRKSHESVLLAKKEQDVGKFGVLKVDGKRIIDLIEKPSESDKSLRYRVIGIYLLTKSFFETLHSTPPAHYSFEHALSAFVKMNAVQMVETEKNIVSLKYPWDLLEVNKYLLSSLNTKISKKASIAKNVSISGEVIIEDGVTVMEQATIKGPCYIGRDSYIGTQAIVRKNVSLGESVVIGANMEIKNSVVLSNTTTHSGFIGDSIIGGANKIAAFFCTGNVRIDRQSIKVQTLKGEIDTNLFGLGVITGNNVKVGIRVSTMPGIIVGNNVVVGPSTTVMGNILDGTIYYTKFKEVVQTNRKSVSVKKSKLVFFDIDYTLFDVSYFDEHFHKRASKVFSIDENVVRKKSLAIIMRLVEKDGYLDIDIYIEKLVQSLGKKDKKREIEEILFGGDFFKYGFYPDVRTALEAIEKIARIGVFSQGHEKLQQAKIDQSGLKRFFNKKFTYIIKPRKIDFLPSLSKKHKNDRVFLVEDKPSVIQKVKTSTPNIFTIWIKRGKFINEAKHIPDFSPDATVISLDQVAEVIENN